MNTTTGNAKSIQINIYINHQELRKAVSDRPSCRNRVNCRVCWTYRHTRCPKPRRWMTPDRQAKATLPIRWIGDGYQTQAVSRPQGEMQAKLDAAAIRSPPGWQAGEGWGRGVGLHKDADKCQVPVSSGDGVDTKLVGLTEIKLAHHLLKCFLADSGLLDPL